MLIMCVGRRYVSDKGNELVNDEERAKDSLLYVQVMMLDDDDDDDGDLRPDR